jgi:mRNA interferase RelE/StbE
MAAEEFEISYEKAAVDDLDSLSTYDQRHVLYGIEKHLKLEPIKESKTRIKKMKQPFWCEYRLRVGEFRVYYDVDEQEGSLTIVRVFEKGRSETPKDKSHETD